MATENEDVKMESHDAVEAVYDAYEKAGPDAGLLSAEDVQPAEEAADAEADKAALGGDKERAVEVPEGEGADRVRDEKTGRFVKQAEEKPAAKAPTIRKGGPAAPATPQTQTAAVPPPAAAAPASDRTLRAPQSWRPGAREGFEKLPPTVRAEVWRLEQEREKVVREAAPLRKTVEDWQRTVAPYEQSIRASGVEPIQAVGNVMRTWYALSTQPEPVRARIIYQLMQNAGVRVDTLADAIDGAGGAPGQQAQPAPGPQPVYDPRFDAFYAQYQQREQANEQAANAAADAELEEFVNGNEFVDDLLPEMSKLMDAGLANDYETAYLRALAFRPDLMEILQQREAAAASPEGPTQRAMRAASSVRGSPGRRPAPGDKKFADSREAAAAAYDQHADSGAGRV